MVFDPKPHLITLPRKVKDPDTGQWTTRREDYLEVKWRLVWFRESYPHGTITTDALTLQWDQGLAIFRATVTDGEGGSATATGTETRKGFEDFVEKAETHAIGRALAALGIGTQFVGQDLSELPYIVDAPVATANGTPPAGPIEGTGLPPDPSRPLTAGEITSLVELAHGIGLDLQGFGHDMRQLLQLPEAWKVTKKLLRSTMTRQQYEQVWEAYSARLRREVEQSLPPDDVLDDAPPAATSSAEG
jgi:hypothetical protein